MFLCFYDFLLTYLLSLVASWFRPLFVWLVVLYLVCSSLFLPAFLDAIAMTMFSGVPTKLTDPLSLLSINHYGCEKKKKEAESQLYRCDRTYSSQSKSSSVFFSPSLSCRKRILTNSHSLAISLIWPMAMSLFAFLNSGSEVTLSYQHHSWNRMRSIYAHGL